MDTNNYYTILFRREEDLKESNSLSGDVFECASEQHYGRNNNKNTSTLLYVQVYNKMI